MKIWCLIVTKEYDNFEKLCIWWSNKPSDRQLSTYFNNPSTNFYKSLLETGRYVNSEGEVYNLVQIEEGQEL